MTIRESSGGDPDLRPHLSNVYFEPFHILDIKSVKLMTRQLHGLSLDFPLSMVMAAKRNCDGLLVG